MDLNNKKVGRNEACPCGSGKKYKKCCLLLVERRITERPIAASDIKSEFSRYFTPDQWAESEPQHFDDLDRLIRRQISLPPSGEDGLWDPIPFGNFLNTVRAAMENKLVDAASPWSPFRWLFYLRNLPAFVWKGRLATTGPYDRSLAELLTSTSTAESTFNPNVGFPLDDDIADQVTSFCCGVRFLSTIHSNLRWCGKGARFEAGKFVIGKPVSTPEISDGVELYDRRVAAMGGLFLGGTGSLAVTEGGRDAVLGINVMVKSSGPSIEEHDDIAGIPALRFFDANFDIVPVFLDDLARLNLRAKVKNIRWWPDEVGPLLMLLRLVSPILDSDRSTRDRASMWGGVLMPEEEFLNPSDELFADAISFVHQVFPEIDLPSTPVDMLRRLEDLEPSFWPLRSGSPLRRAGEAFFIDVHAATILMNQLLEFETSGGGPKGVLRGAHFEEKVQGLIDVSPWAPGEELAKHVGMDLYRGSQLVTDLDALGTKDGVLLMVSCKSLAKTMQYDAGDFQKVRAAKSTVEKAVLALRQLEIDIQQDPGAFNFPFSRYQKIVPVVCVPHVIYVPAGPATEFVAPGLRAAVSANELRVWMKDAQVP